MGAAATSVALGRRGALIAAAVLAWALLPGSAAAAPGMHLMLQDDAVLIHGSDEDVDRALDDLQAMGVDWVRVTAGWGAIAPADRDAPGFDPRDPATYPGGAWARLDRVVLGAERRGLEVNVDIAFWAPDWAVGRRLPSRQRWQIDPAEFGAFAEAVARRYSGSWVRDSGQGVIPRPPVVMPAAAAFTVWNEPNHRAFLQPQWRRSGSRLVPDSPHAYRRMLEAAVPAIREAAPHGLVLIGATSAIGTDRPRSVQQTMAPLRFMRELACVDRRLRPLRRAECRGFRPLDADGWSHHPYSIDRAPWQRDPSPENVRLGDLRRMTSLLGRLARTGRTTRRLPVYITEYGYQTNPPDPTARVGLLDQARYLAEAELIAYRDPEVASFAQFLLVDRPVRGVGGDYQSGLRFADGRPKPAERAFAKPFVVRPASRGRVRFWGRSRRDVSTMRITTPGRDGVWRPVRGAAELVPDGQGVVAGTFRGSPRRLYRLESLGSGGDEWTGGVALGARKRSPHLPLRRR